MFKFISNYLEPLACLVYFVALLIYYRSNKNKVASLLLGYYALATVLHTIGSVGVRFAIPNVWIYDLVAAVGMACFAFYFYQLLHSPAKKRTVVVLALVYFGYAVYRNLSVQGVRIFDSIGYSLMSAAVVIYVFMYFHQVLKNVSEISIFKDFNFWLTSGYLLYYVGSFIIFVTYFYFTNRFLASPSIADSRLLTALWGLHNVLLFVGALSLLAGSLWVIYRKRST